jgi:hypothetical protein
MSCRASIGWPGKNGNAQNRFESGQDEVPVIKLIGVNTMARFDWIERDMVNLITQTETVKLR